MDPNPETVIAARAEAVVIDLQAERDRLAGLSAIEALRADPATDKLPIILATAAVEDVPSLVERLEDLDVALLRKPFAIDKLRDVLGRVLPPVQPVRSTEG